MGVAYEHCTKAWSLVVYTTRSAAQQSSHMASGSSLLLEPTLRRTSYQDRKYDIQEDARRGSIDLAQAGAGESARLKSALSTALLLKPCCKGSDDGKDSIDERLHTFTLKNVLFIGLCHLRFRSNRIEAILYRVSL